MLQGGPVLQVAYEHGRPTSAVALFHVRAPVEALWPIAGQIERFPDLIAMVHTVKPLRGHSAGDAVRVTLRFKLAFFSVKFHFDAAVTRDDVAHRMELSWLGGNIRDVAIRAESVAASESSSILRVHVGFDPRSLGWLVKAFLKHHPEIEGGVHAGAAITIGTASAELAERDWAQGAPRAR